MTDSFSSLAHLANELDAPLKNSIKRLHQIIIDYKDRDFEYISYKDFRRIFTALELIHRQLLRCAVTSNRLLTNGSKSARLDPISSNAHDVINDIIDVISKQLQSTIKFKVQLPTILPALALGHIESFQILNNILMNAVESMPTGGLISIKGKFDTTTKMITLTIVDQGVGMSKEFLANIFEPRQGGLGLAIVHALISVSGGNIVIKSSQRKGTTVILNLPAIIS